MPYTPPSSVSSSLATLTTVTNSRPHASDTQLNVTRQRLSNPSALPRSASFLAHARQARHHESSSSGETALSHQLQNSPSNKNNGTPLSVDTNVNKPGSLSVPVTMTTWDNGVSSQEDSGSSEERLRELGNAVRNIKISRDGSPDYSERSESSTGSSSRDETHLAPPASRLSPSARKISHSRSTTEASVLNPPLTPDESPSAGSEGSDEDDQGLHMRPPMLRKKSGELVKPAIRPQARRKVSSMPGTPTYSKKGVHFNDDIQQVRHFLQVDRPIAVSAGGSPNEVLEDEPEFPFPSRQSTRPSFGIRLGNFPQETLERQSLPVRLDHITLSGDSKCLVGAIAVANIAFGKFVAARFTFDNWKTTSEVVAEYNNDVRLKPREDGYDRFDFNVKLTDQANLDKKTMLICIRYCVKGQEFWDNNDSKNFRVDFEKTPPIKRDDSQTSRPGTSPIPKSRKNSLNASSRTQSLISFDDDFTRTFDPAASFKFAKEPPPTRKASSDGPPRRANDSSQQFGNRYDFGASLTALLKQAKTDADGKQGVDVQQAPEATSKAAGASQTAPSQRPAAPKVARQGLQPPPGSGADSPRTSNLVPSAQSMNSEAYQEFLSRFCYVSYPSHPIHGTEMRMVINY